MTAAHFSVSGAMDGADSIGPAAAQVTAAVDPLAQAAAGHRREKFLPVTRHALLDRLTMPALWPKGDHVEARRFLRYLDYWRRHSYSAKLLDLEQLYEPFSPDTDLLQTRAFTPHERQAMQKRLVAHMADLLTQGNFTRIAADQFHIILTTDDSHYGLDLQVDTDDFEELLIFYRGASTITERHRDIRKAYIGWREVKVPVYQRLFILFKLKPFEARVQELMDEPRPDKRKLDRNRAEAIVRRQRKMLPDTVSSDFVYIKLFKNIPRTDLEMAFPNTEVRFRLLDKIKLGLTAGSGVGAGVVGTATKLAMISNPYTLVMALAGLGGVAARQVTNFINQRNRYMAMLAKNLYFHSMADNRGVMTLLADRAADEDIKEEMLLYTAIANERFRVHDLETIDRGIEGYLSQTFGIDVDFDVSDALERLQKEGVVTVLPDGTLQTLPPQEAALLIDRLWDACLDQLPDITTTGEGREIETEPAT
jgi:hypothetical protein